MKRSISERLRRTQNMLAGLTVNTERLNKRGLDTRFMTDFTMAYQTTVDLDNRHEAAKAFLKEKTAEFHTQLGKLEEFYREAKKTVKLEMSQESWKEFGVYDQQ